MTPTGPVAAAGPVALTPIVVDAIVNDLVYDAQRDLVYATVDGSDPALPNRVIVVDADTGAIVSSTLVGTNPAAIAVSDDGSRLYVGIDGRGTVEQFMLPSMTPGWTITLGSRFGQILAAREIEVMPTTPDSIAISRMAVGNHGSDHGVVIVDGGTQRPEPFTAVASGGIEFRSPTELLAINTISSGGDLTRLDVTPDGLAERDSTPNLLRFAYPDFEVMGGDVITSEGRIIDVMGTSPILRDTLAVPNFGRAIAIDGLGNTVYVSSSSQQPILGFDLITRQLEASFTVTGIPDAPRRMRSLGQGRLAFQSATHPLGRGKLVIVHTDGGTTDPEPPNGPPTDSEGEYTPLTPQRILDTRSGLGRNGLRSPIGPGQAIDVSVAGVGGVPASGVSAVVLNVTAVFPSDLGYLTVFPTGIAVPTISNLNFEPGAVVANLVTMPVGAGGKVSVFNPFGNVDVLFDVAGYYATVTGTPGLRFHPLSPTRFMDTRDGTGGRLGPLGAGESTTLVASGRDGVPSNAKAVALNVTVTGTSSPSFVSVFPNDVLRPVVSNLNFGAGTTIANQAIVRLPASGVLGLYNESGVADIIVDVVGYYDEIEVGDKGRFLPASPDRYIDTRLDSPFPAPGWLRSGNTLYTPDTDPVSAYVLNVTVTVTQGAGYLTVYPFTFGSVPPNASNVNYGPGKTVPNHVIAPAGPSVGFYNFGGTAHLIVDVFGVFL